MYSDLGDVVQFAIRDEPYNAIIVDCDGVDCGIHREIEENCLVG